MKLVHDMEEGLSVIVDGITDLRYCGICGMPILNEDWWKEIHLEFHKK